MSGTIAIAQKFLKIIFFVTLVYMYPLFQFVQQSERESNDQH